MAQNEIVVCTWEAGGEGLTSGTEETLTLARKLGADVTLLVLGPLSDGAREGAGSFGVARIDHADDAKLGEFAPDTFVSAVEQYGKAASPKVLLLNQTFDARSVAPRVAARLGAGVVMNGVDLAVDGDTIKVTCSAFGGDTRTSYDLSGASSYVVCVSDNACVPEPASSPNAPGVENVSIDVGGVEERIRVIENPKSEGPKLEDAQIIVAGGRGLQAPENFKLVDDLAEALGGVSAASRPIVDDGWATPAQQVGLTGKITKPALYVAAGISGASQHMVGCSAAKVIVAINTDPDAAIFRQARYGIVADCLEMLPEITKALKS